MKEKKCPKCGITKSINSFVTIYGYKNPRGKYCYKCHLILQREQVITLMEGRDFCLYCGKKIMKAYDWSKDGKSSKTYINLDHMDPISRGGDDSENNTVYCCVSCNRKKGNKLFIVWLKRLENKYRTLSSRIYIKKHKRRPEEFEPSSSKTILTISVDRWSLDPVNKKLKVSVSTKVNSDVAK